jgi:hypothetical protein
LGPPLSDIVDLLPPEDWDRIEAGLGHPEGFREQVAILVWKRLRQPKLSRVEAKKRQKWVSVRRKQLQRALVELKNDDDEWVFVVASGLDAALERFESMHDKPLGKQPDLDDHALRSGLARTFKILTGKNPGFTERIGEFSGEFVEFSTFVDHLVAAGLGKEPRANSTIGANARLLSKHWGKLKLTPR